MLQSYEKKRAYVEELSGWLESMDWKHFFTLTFPYECTLSGARRHMSRFHSRINEKVFNGERARIFWAAEPHELKDGFHLHGLMDYDQEWFAGPNKNLRPALCASHWVASGAHKMDEYAHADFQMYKQEKHGSLYCSKYLMKRHSDYDIMV